MISEKDIYPVGKLVKTHGLQGEFLYECPQGLPDEDFRYLLLKPDGIIVPFYLENIRYRNETSGFIKLEGIDDAENTCEYVGLTMYLDRNVVDFSQSDEILINYFIGFQLIDEKSGYLGEIINVDETTANTLFVVDNKKGEILIPATDDFIVFIDHAEKKIHLSIPNGLLDL